LPPPFQRSSARVRSAGSREEAEGIEDVEEAEEAEEIEEVEEGEEAGDAEGFLDSLRSLGMAS